MKTKKRFLFGAASVLLLAVLLLGRGKEEQAAAPPAAAATGPGVERSYPDFLPVEAPPAPPPVTIESVTLDKTEVCRGEENFVNVKAVAAEGSADDLRIVIPGLDTAGPRMPFRIRSEWPEDPPMEVSVFSSSGELVTARVPRVKVKDCDEAKVLMVRAQLLPNSSADYEFSAQILQAPAGAAGSAFVPTRFEWDFGDGTRETTAVPRVEHSYAARRQDKRYSYFLVTAIARDAVGDSVTGSSGFELRNMARETLEKKGIVSILSQLTPRFPQMGADGIVRQNARLFHAHDQPVRLKRVTITDYGKDASGAEVASSYDYEAGYVLGFDNLGPGEQRETRQLLNTQEAPDVHVRTIEIEGQSADGHVARGLFSVMLPPPTPTRDNSKAVLSKRLTAEILLAQEILGKEFVTDGDLHRLRVEGRFAAIDVPPEEGPALEPMDEVATTKPRSRAAEPQ